MIVKTIEIISKHILWKNIDVCKVSNIWFNMAPWDENVPLQSGEKFPWDENDVFENQPSPWTPTRLNIVYVSVFFTMLVMAFVIMCVKIGHLSEYFRKIAIRLQPFFGYRIIIKLRQKKHMFIVFNVCVFGKAHN